MSTSTRRVSLRIHGTVQGVYFRESARGEATRLGLTGWVRNRSDGTVEALAEGPPDALEAFIHWCHQGPPTARVSHVERSEGEPSSGSQPSAGPFSSFTVERTQ